MGKVYQSVRGMVQGTLNRKKDELPVAVQTPDKVSLDDAMQALEKGVVSGLARLKVSARDDQAAAANKLEQAEQVIAGLRARVAGLEVQLRETQEALQKKQAASEQMEENLGAEIRDLQSTVKQKEEALENRDSEVSDLKSQTEVLEKLVSDLESAIQETRETAAADAHNAARVIDDLKASLSGLAGRLREAEETLKAKEAASEQREESLGAEIRHLQSAVKEKDEILENRDSQIDDLKSQTAVLEKQVSDLESAIQQSKEAAASAAERAGQVILDLGAKVAGLEAQQRTAEETAQRKEAASQQTEENLAAEIRELQAALKQKDETLENRETEILHLQSQREVLGKQVSDLESAIQQAKDEAADEAGRAGQVIQDLRVEIATLQARLRQKEHELVASHFIKDFEPKPNKPIIGLGADLAKPRNGTKEPASRSTKAAASQESQTQELEETRVTSPVPDAAQETVSRDAFNRLAAEFSECANVITSMALLIMRHHVKSLGESMENFPRARLGELLESLSREISNEKLKANFLARLGR